MKNTNFKGIILISTLLFIIFSISAISAESVDTADNQADIQDNSQINQLTQSENTIKSDESSNYETLNTNIASSDSIDLSSNITRDDSEENIAISKSLTINGNGYTIDAKGASAFVINGSDITVTLSNLNIINAYTNSTGAAIYVVNGSLNIDNCTFINNTAKSGSCLYTKTSNNNITNSNFINNTAANGGAIYLLGSSYNVISSNNFTNNKATSADGGAIGLSTSQNNTISNNTFDSNTAATYGGAISLNALASYNNLTDNRFTNNTASSDGASIYLAFNANSNNISTNTLINNTGSYDVGISSWFTTSNSITYNNFDRSESTAVASVSGNTIENNTYDYVETETTNDTTNNTTNDTTNETTNDTNTTTNATKLNTIININDVTMALGQSVNLTATITDEEGNPVNGGKIVFKVNGLTVKDENNKVIYAKVTNGTAQIEYTLSDTYSGDSLNLTVVYSGTSSYTSARNNTTVTITKDEPSIEITPITDSVAAGSTITIQAQVKVGEDPITSGKVVFKLNGKTLKDDNGKVIYANVDENGTVSVEYTIPDSYKAKTYTLTAIFISSAYDRIQNQTDITVTSA